MTNIPDARGRILKTAIQVFAEKGYAGARIDDIAGKAHVPKSLIYYHFKNKEDILNVLIHDFLEAFRRLFQTAMHNGPRDNGSPAALKSKFEDYYLDFLIQNIDLLRIIMIESLKNNSEIPSIFVVVEELVKYDREETKAASSYDIHERQIAEFFTSLIPIFTFFCFQGKWCDYFSVEADEAQRLFMDLYAKTHGAYHKGVNAVAKRMEMADQMKMEEQITMDRPDRKGGMSDEEKS